MSQLVTAVTTLTRRVSRDERGFTLIELLVTVTIIGILSAVVSIGVGGGTANANIKAKQGSFNQVQTSVDAFIASAPGNGVSTAAASSSNLQTVSCDTGAAALTVACSLTFYDQNGGTAATPSLTDFSIDIAASTLVAASFLRLEATTSLICTVGSATSTQIKACK